MHKNVSIKEIDIKYLKTKTQELQAMFGQARSCFAQITGSNEPFDNFMEKFEVILRATGKELEQFNNNLKEVETQHKFMMEYFGIDKND